MEDTLILAIESSCDETAASVVKNGRTVLSNVISSQIELHKLYGGVVPEIASRKHIEKINQVIEEALTESDLSNGAFAGLVKQEKCLVLHEEDDEYETLENVYRLKYEEFIMLNVHMTQKLYKRIEELETKITQLTDAQETSEINELDNELNTVENISFEGLE